MENINCMDVIENLGYINLIDHTNKLWDPQNLTEFQQQPHASDGQLVNGVDLVGEEPKSLHELGFMFLEWLESNKPKRSTVGSDSKQLGSTTEGKKWLMKLVIEWASCQFPFRYQEPVPNISISDPVSPASRYLATSNNNNREYNSNSNFPNDQGCHETEDQVPDQYCDKSGKENLAQLGSFVTSVVRKKRMARRNRFLSHNSYSQSHKFYEKRNVEKQCRHGNENRANEDRWQGRKSKNKVRFLLRKVLTQSDVGYSGRIVLPKNEAETHLPTLTSRNGIPIAMEDFGTSRAWSLVYRFWPNNKSRMYILYNTGAFVRFNRLQEGDTIMIYKDIKSNKYLIRGVRRNLDQEACDEP